MRVTFFVVIGLFLLSVAPAWADTDYVCLNECVKGGAHSSQCFNRCAYSSSLAQTSTSRALTKTPVPEELVEKKVKVVKKEEAGVDYVCRAPCFQQGYSYDYCINSCRKK